MPRPWLVIPMVAACALAVAGEPKEEPRSIYVTAPIEVAADGHAEIGEFEGASPPLAQLARTLLSRQRYLPAKRAGVPVPSRSHVAAILMLTPAGERFEVSLGSVRVGPRAQKWRRPDYSPDVARRSGIVERMVLLRIQVNEEGRPVASTVVTPTERIFERDAIKTVRDWRFDPLLIAGKPAAYEVIQPFWFHEYRKGKLPAFQCPANDSIPRADAQDGCQEAVEVTGVWVRNM
jgi:TonB family protein